MYDEQISDRVDDREAPVPPDDMLAAAARILGVADAAPADNGEQDATVREEDRGVADGVAESRTSERGPRRTARDTARTASS